MPYISKTRLSLYKKATAKAVSLQEELDALEESTVAKDTYLSAKKSLSEAKNSLTKANQKVKHYSGLYTGMKGKYEMTKNTMRQMKATIDSVEAKLTAEEARSKMFQKKYEDTLRSSATSRTILTKMKMKYQHDMQRLNGRLIEAEKQATFAKQQASDLLARIDEIEKNEKMAREGSLTQAVVNTRDFVFDNTIAGVQMSETSSRGLSLLAGAAVTAFLITRVS